MAPMGVQHGTSMSHTEPRFWPRRLSGFKTRETTKLGTLWTAQRVHQYQLHCLHSLCAHVMYMTLRRWKLQFKASTVAQPCFFLVYLPVLLNSTAETCILNDTWNCGDGDPLIFYPQQSPPHCHLSICIVVCMRL